MKLSGKAYTGYAIKMPTVGILTKTMAASEKEAIQSFAKFEPRLTWIEALNAGFKCVKLIVLEMNE